MIKHIEINFAIPVEFTSEQQHRLFLLMQEIARANQPDGKVHWVSGYGSKPLWDEPNEPKFLHEVYYMETYCRDRYESEAND